MEFNKKSSFILLTLLLILPLLVFLVKKNQNLFLKASEKPANIVIDSTVNLGTHNFPWRALAQGGEEKENMLEPVIGQTLFLTPKYIRIDHIYDFYDVVKRENGDLSFNFEKLDRIVEDILLTGALPFLSLSYMPEVLSVGDIVDQPKSWQEWELLVKETVSHYSGKDKKAIPGVIYEVWNEPDLFGNWKMYGKKNYSLLYYHTVKAAQSVENTQRFEIGGPSTTAPYKTWVDDFLSYVFENNLRIDFYSWHRYSKNPNDFLGDIDKIDSWLFKNAGYTIPKYITEWGSDSENSPLHDSSFDAAHLIAVMSKILQRVDLAFVFEIKDGLSPNKEKYWGRWGLLTHELAGPVEKKPKYFALQMLNQMDGNVISLKGENSFINGFATKEKNNVNIILSNLDENNLHSESFPLTINNLESGNYKIKIKNLDNIEEEKIIATENSSISQNLFLKPNDVILLKLEKINTQ
ncbi:MAG: glycosyl hydrolase [Patescibacteria group bacterium]|nr:hypothetical protein [Patescibacteria group bacterium]